MRYRREQQAEYMQDQESLHLDDETLKLQMLRRVLESDGALPVGYFKASRRSLAAGHVFVAASLWEARVARRATATAEPIAVDSEYRSRAKLIRYNRAMAGEAPGCNLAAAIDLD
jgi:hypothetical protein